DPADLLEQVSAGSLVAKADDGQKTLDDSELAGVFGIELDTTAAPEPDAVSERPSRTTGKAAVKTSRSAALKGTKRGTTAAKKSKAPAKSKTTVKSKAAGRGKKPR